MPRTRSKTLDQLQFSSHVGLNARAIDYRYRVLARHYRGKTCLEFGCADGRGLEVLLAHFDKVVAVDGSQRLLDELRARVASPKLEVVCSLFEDLDLGRRFDTVQLGHILEHVDDPRRVIAVAARHLSPRGVLIADVPNANSLHRHVGVALGLLGKVTDLNDADRSIGHQRVYTPERFRRELERAGLEIVREGGVFMKPLANAQLEKMLDAAQIEAFFAVGEKFPDIAADIYVVARRPR